MNVALLVTRFIFIAILSTISAIAGGVDFLQRPVGVIYLVLFTIWMIVTVLGRKIGSISTYNRSQRLIITLGSLALIPLLIAPWEYNHFSGPIPRNGFLAWIGLALFATGITLQSAAMQALQGGYTLRLSVQRGHQLITSGLYRDIRHPGYLSNIIEMFGAGLALSSLITLATAFLVIPLLLLRIRDEEKMLLQEFPGYKAYMKRTKRLLPFIW